MVNLSNIRVAFGERVIFNNEDFLLRLDDKVGTPVMMNRTGSRSSSVSTKARASR
jgi:hypothetical protein